jgi:hypothetical protein
MVLRVVGDAMSLKKLIHRLAKKGVLPQCSVDGCENAATNSSNYKNKLPLCGYHRRIKGTYEKTRTPIDMRTITERLGDNLP